MPLIDIHYTLVVFIHGDIPLGFELISTQSIKILFFLKSYSFIITKTKICQKILHLYQNQKQ